MNNKKHIEDILYYFEKYHYENMILDDNETKFIHDYIINLQSKIDKAIDKINQYELILGYYDSNYDEYDDTYSHKIKDELLDILKEDK